MLKGIKESKQVNASHIPSNQKIQRPLEPGPVSTGCPRRLKSWPLWRQRDFCHQRQWSQDISKPPAAWRADFWKDVSLPRASCIRAAPATIRFAFSNALRTRWVPVSLQHVFWIGTRQLGRGWCWWALRTSVPLWFLPPVSWDVPLTPRHVVGPSTPPARTAAPHGQALCNHPRQKSKRLLCVSTRLFSKKIFWGWRHMLIINTRTPPTQSERVWKRFERFSRTAFLVSCSDDINLLLRTPASAFPFPALGASPELGHLWWQVTFELMDYLLKLPSPASSTCCAVEDVLIF